MKLLNLPLALCNIARIDITRFKSCKQELNRGCIITMRPREQDWNVQTLHKIDRAFTRSIGGIIMQNHCIRSPGSILLIEPLHELS